MEEVIYYMKERVRIVREVGADYLIEDAATGKQYMIDKAYFHRKYTTEAELIPVHQELWDKLKNLGYQLFQLKRANTKLRNELRGERKKVEELRKGKKEHQHYRNGQKRGRTRNG